jgi:hypothetical protein
MPDYRRAWHPGGTYFFTVNALQRHGNDLLTRHVEALRDVEQRGQVRISAVGRKSAAHSPNEVQSKSASRFTTMPPTATLSR